MIKFSCNNCGRKIGVKDERAGKRGKCPECHNPIVVPERTILINFNCDNCGESISAPGTRAGKKGTCPKCKHTLVIPAAHNLTLLIASIFSTFVQYCGLVILVGGVILILGAVTNVETDHPQQSSAANVILGAVFYAFALYAALIVAHLLGRFYWKYQEKLNWEV